MQFFRFFVLGIAKVLSKVFGVATMSFFGRMPSREDDKIALVAVLSIGWIPIVAAIFLPGLAEMMIPFAPDDDETLRWLAVGLTLLMPIAVGITVAMMRNNRGRGWGHTLKQVALGYPYTAVVGVTVVLVIIVVPFVKASYIVRRFEVMRVLVMVEAGAYQGAIDHIVEQLQANGVEVDVDRANWAVDRLFRILGWVLGRIFERDVADELRVLRPKQQDADRDEWFEITLHSTDMTIIGPQEIGSRLHAILVDAMDERVLYLTWDDESQELEDRIRQARQRLDDGDLLERSETDALVDDLAELALGKEEWNAVRRLIYRLERDAEAKRADAAQETAGAC